MLGKLFKKSDKATDPICLMKVNKETASFRTTHLEKTYYFCSNNCYQEFKNDPEKYKDLDGTFN